MMQTSAAISIVNGLSATAAIPTPGPAQDPMPEKPVLDVAAGCGAVYIELAAIVRRSEPRPWRTNGCAADRESTFLKW